MQLMMWPGECSGSIKIISFFKSFLRHWLRVRSKIFVTWFVVTPQNATNCMFPESTCLKTNFDTYLEFLFLVVAEKSAGEVDQFRIFFAFPAIHAFTKLVITFDGLNRFLLTKPISSNYSLLEWSWVKEFRSITSDYIM